MEAEELEAISVESALLWKEQQALLREMARAKHEGKLASIKVMLSEEVARKGGGSNDGGRGGNGGGDGGDGVDELASRVAVEEANVARLRTELDENRRALQGLQEEIPARIVSSQR